MRRRSPRARPPRCSSRHPRRQPPAWSPARRVRCVRVRIVAIQAYAAGPRGRSIDGHPLCGLAGGAWLASSPALEAGAGAGTGEPIGSTPASTALGHLQRTREKAIIHTKQQAYHFGERCVAAPLLRQKYPDHMFSQPVTISSFIQLFNR